MNAMRLISFQRSSHARAAMCPAVPAARTAAPQAQKPAAPADLTLENLSVSYGAPGTHQAVVRNFSLRVPAGQTACLLGPSGCGKTTVLRAIAGFEPAMAGRILLGDQVLSAPGTHVLPEHRRMGMVFQDHALFPHLNAAQNIAFGLQGQTRAQRAERVAQMLDLVGLAGMDARYPHELSGGQRQRVVIARALALSPRLLVLDEPVSALDLSVLAQVLNLLADLQDEFHLTYVFISHDLSVVRHIADDVMVMYFGEAVEYGSRDQVFEDPQHSYTKTLFAATPRVDVDAIRARIERRKRVA